MSRSSLLLMALVGPALCPLCSSFIQGQTYTFTTIAGSPGQSGSADGTNTNARFYNPSSLCLDTSGNLYVADALNHTIRKLTRSGSNWVVSTIAGLARQSGTADGTNSEARFNKPRGLVWDNSGGLLIADTGNSTLRAATYDGTNWFVTTLAGTAGTAGFLDGTSTNTLFNQPRGVATAPGNVFLADGNNNVIRQVVPAGDQSSVALIAGFPGPGGFVDGLGTAAGFGAPHALCAEDEATIYVSDSGNNGIRQMKQTPEGWMVTTIAGVLNAPADSVDGEGSAARFFYPMGIARDRTGNLHVADQGNHTIRLLVPTNGSWFVSTLAGRALQAGTNDGVGLDARFNKPWGVAVDSGGVLYVADHSNHTIRMGVPSGTVVTGVALNVLSTNGALIIFWPVSAVNYALETTPAIGIGLAWSEIKDGIATTPDSFVFTKPADGQAAYFRLKHR